MQDFHRFNTNLLTPDSQPTVLMHQKHLRTIGVGAIDTETEHNTRQRYLSKPSQVQLLLQYGRLANDAQVTQANITCCYRVRY